MKQSHIYYDLPYLETVKAKVIDAFEEASYFHLAFDNNLFHMQGGGQPGDICFVDNYQADQLMNKNGITYVSFKKDSFFYKDFKRYSTLSIDLSHRNICSALHTAGHLLNAYMSSLGHDYFSCNHYPGQARVEFKEGYKKINKDKLTRLIEAEVSQFILQDVPVFSLLKQDGTRLVKIKGIALDSCGGTHVRSLGEIKGFKVRSLKYKKEHLIVGYNCTYFDI